MLSGHLLISKIDFFKSPCPTGSLRSSPRYFFIRSLHFCRRAKKVLCFCCWMSNALEATRDQGGVLSDSLNYLLWNLFLELLLFYSGSVFGDLVNRILLFPNDHGCSVNYSSVPLLGEKSSEREIFWVLLLRCRSLHSQIPHPPILLWPHWFPSTLRDSGKGQTKSVPRFYTGTLFLPFQGNFRGQQTA